MRSSHFVRLVVVALASILLTRCGDAHPPRVPDQQPTAPEAAEHVVVIEAADHVVVIEAAVVKDAKAPLHSDAPFEGPGTNGAIGIGGGAGGAFGGRRGGRRALRAGGGGKRAAPVAGNPGPLRAGRLVARRDGADPVVFPLKHTHVDAEVSGRTARTRVLQVFENRFSDPVEAVYVFPLPTSAAVHDFEMTVGGRRIVGVVRPRAEARQIYREARARGQTASLLDQDRPNVFRQSIANIAPGETVDVELVYHHGLDYVAGAFEYHFPMRLDPRFTPASTTESVSGPTAAGTRCGWDVSLELSVDAGTALDRLECATHKVDVFQDSRTSARLRLLPAERIADRDFVARIVVGGGGERTGFVAHVDKTKGGFFSAFVLPDLGGEIGDACPREITFLIDASGSMKGPEIAACKRIVKRVLTGLRPYDRFNVISFSDEEKTFSQTPVDASPDRVAAGVEFVDAVVARGSTRMMRGLAAVASQPRDSRYLRIVCFLSDGLVGNETEILHTIRWEGRDARWFAFGIGSNVNRYLVEGIAEHGRGAAEVVVLGGPDQAPEMIDGAADRFSATLDAPLLTDVYIETGDLEVTDLQPRRLPDLTAGRPVTILGRFSGGTSGVMELVGRVGSREVRIPIPLDLPEVADRHAGLAPLWARAKIHTLSGDLLDQEGEMHQATCDSIRDLALDFGLMSAFTSFVAVDETRQVGDGHPTLALQPFQDPTASASCRLAAFGLRLSETIDREVRVVSVEEDGPAGLAGVRAGDVVHRLGGFDVLSANHLGELVRRLDRHGATLELARGELTTSVAPR